MGDDRPSRIVGVVQPPVQPVELLLELGGEPVGGRDVLNRPTHNSANPALWSIAQDAHVLADPSQDWLPPGWFIATVYWDIESAVHRRRHPPRRGHADLLPGYRQ